MGADFVYQVLPYVLATDARKEQLRQTIEGLPEQDGYDKESLLVHADEYWNLDGRRDVGILHFQDDIPYFITGGMSWGDSPTDAMDTLDALASSNAVWNLLEQWADEGGDV